MSFNIKNLELYIKNHKNILLVGKHGIGKTAIIKQLFDKHFKGRYLYLSSSLLDPWVDFCGVPQAMTNEETGEKYIELIRPKYLQNDDIEAIFLDEFNRAKPPVLAATMELLQFKTIHGKKYNNLKLIVAAINPPDDSEVSYMVEPLDPAIEDRFEIKIEMPYLLDHNFFSDKFGKEMADTANAWWNSLDIKTRSLVSPRRMEYALDIYKLKGNLRDVLPPSVNISHLMEELKLGPLSKRVEDLLTKSDDVVKEALKDANMISFIQRKLKEKAYIEKFTKFLPEEIIQKKATESPEMCKYIKDNRGIFSTSLIGTLDTGGFFKESAFAATFFKLNEKFSSATYTASNKKKLLSILKDLPEINAIKIEKSDLTGLIKLLTIVNLYCYRSNNINLDNIHNNKFIDKFRDLFLKESVAPIGINISKYPNISRIISTYETPHTAPVSSTTSSTTSTI